MCLLLFWYMKQETDNHKEETNSLKDAINELKLAINTLISKFDN